MLAVILAKSFVLPYKEVGVTSIVTATKKRGYIKLYDIKKLDLEILKKIECTYKEMMAQPKPVRIRVTTIEKRANIRINRRIDKLPKCRKYLLEILESVDEFTIRRLKVYCESEENIKSNLTRSQILRENSIQISKLGEDIRNQVDDIISRYIENIKGELID